MELRFESFPNVARASLTEPWQRGFRTWRNCLDTALGVTDEAPTLRKWVPEFPIAKCVLFFADRSANANISNRERRASVAVVVARARQVPRDPKNRGSMTAMRSQLEIQHPQGIERTDAQDVVNWSLSIGSI